MRVIGEYKLFETVQEDFLSTVYQARGPQKKSNLVRVLRPHVLSNSEAAQLRYAAKRASKLKIDGIIRPVDFVEAEGTFSIVSEGFDGFPLASEGKGISMTLGSFLVFAKQLAETLGQIHRANIVHNLLSFDSIYFDSTRGQAKITHFATESTTDLLLDCISDPLIIRRILPYLSPEQTGRMNRIVDYRSDLYSIGVVFYELLTGTVPFSSVDPLEIFHGHIARKPTPVVELDHSIPRSLSNMVDKLLSKNAAERYQNGYGLLHDLVHFEQQWREDKRVEVFALGTKDISTKFVLPKTLIGREVEESVITDAFYRVCGGRSEVLIVKGEAGVGKTAIIRELNKYIVEQRGYFIRENFEKLDRGAEHNTLLQIFRRFAGYMLGQSQEVIRSWKNRAEKALGENVDTVLDVLPEFESLFDRPREKDPSASHRGENIHRLQQSLRQLIRVIASKNRPIVVALDDVQWADNTSLEFLSRAALDGDVRHVLWILSFRDDHLDKLNPLSAVIEKLRRAQKVPKEILIRPFNQEQTTEYVNAILLSDPRKVEPLGELLHQKTGGNPFFLGQFLLRLYDNEAFQTVKGEGWSFDLRKVSETNIADNVVDLLMNTIERLAENVQQTLQIASCIGIRFRPTTLAIIMENDIDEVLDQLAVAVEDGFVGKTRDEYYFVHDRVHDTVYSLMPKENRLRTHHRIGVLIWAPTPPDELENVVFEIVNQLNLAREFFRDTDERIEIAKLNLTAGRKAKAAGFYSSALKYLETGIDFMGEKRWTSQYDLHIALNEEALESAYLAREHAKMSGFAVVLIGRAKNPMGKVKAFELLIQSAHAEMGPNEAVDYGIVALEELGVHLSTKWPRLAARWRLLKTRRKFYSLTSDKLLNLPQVDDQEVEAVFRIMKRMELPAFFVSPSLWQILITEHLEYVLKYGLSSGFSAALCSYAAIESASRGKSDTGLHLGRMSLQVAEELGDEEAKAHTLLNFHSLIQHWHSHVAKDLDAVLEVAEESATRGAFVVAASLLAIWESHSIIAGRELGLLEKELEETGRQFVAMGQSIHILTNLSAKQFVHNLIYRKDDPSQLMGLYYDNEEMRPLLRKTGNLMGRLVTDAYQIILNCLLGKYERAVESTKVISSHADDSRALHLLAVAEFYSAIAYLKVAEGLLQGREKRHYRRRAKRILSKLKTWNRGAPENYDHRVKLVEAEFSLTRGEYTKALKLYEDAARVAMGNGYVHESGMAYEFIADALLSRGHRRLAKVFCEKSRDCYQKWGAWGKVDVLEEKYPSLLQKNLEPVFLNTVSQIDYEVVIRALQEISTEIELRRLLEKVIKTLTSVSGANKAQLFMADDGTLQLEASQSLAEGEDITVGTRKMPPEKEVFLSVINYVWRAREPVVIDSAVDTPNYRTDPYVIKEQVRSVLCLPVKRQEGLLGIIYLENSVAEGAFTPERIEALELLAAQAAISVENARLYDNVLETEKTSRALSSSLIVSNDELKNSLAMLAESERRLSIVLSGANLGLWDYTAGAGKIVFNERFAYLHNMPEDIRQMDIDEFFNYVHPENFKQATDLFAEMAEDPVGEFDLEYRVRADEGWRWLLCRGKIASKDESTRVIRGTGIILDIDPRKKAEERKSQLKNQFLQQQKIESIGQLTGGIAHDLNNLITPILGYADLIKEDIADDPVLCEEVDEIRYAGKRARDLIKQLLAFGRKQVLEWKVLDIGDVILEFERVLKGVVREDIELEISVSRLRAKIRVDPAQLQQILLNLVVNSRDAMPSGGEISLETDRVELGENYQDAKGGSEAGKYVVLRVGDTGQGMDDETMKRVFEPFFTTKEVGKGTGLGLSTVYGIIKQHRGHIEVQSSPGEGTLFTLYFPEIEALSAEAQGEGKIDSDTSMVETTVLIVDDETAVRRLVTNILEKRGYKTLVASGGEEALSIALTHSGKIDLLLTDIVMPQMNGQEVFEKIHRSHPETKVLYMSGYAQENFLAEGIGEREWVILNKPFSPDLLDRKVRETLES